MMTENMNPEVKELWLKALRSGSFPQTDGVLHLKEDPDSGTPDSYCCLGVLCEIAVAQGVVKVFPDDPFRSAVVYEDGDNECGESETLPRKVREWAGIDSCNPDIEYDGHVMPISEVNDSYKQDFNVIADLIEEQY